LMRETSAGPFSFYGRHNTDSSSSFFFHNYLSLSLSTDDDGACFTDRHPKNSWLKAGLSVLQHCRAILGENIRINFLFGVITGIPMEFQFGTNWSKFSTFAGGVIGQTLAMEGSLHSFSNRHFWVYFSMEKRDWEDWVTGSQRS
jgi:hypothetical protein